MSREWKLFFPILLIVSISIQGYSIHAYMAAENRRNGVWCYRVHPLDYIADDCWNLTGPDPYILEAIRDVGEWTLPFDYRDSSFWYIAPWHDHYNQTLYEVLGRRPKPFLYNGTCYDYDVTYAGTYIVVEVLDEPPEKYWNVTNPDKRLLEGIKNLGKDILIPWFSDETLGPHPFRYNGAYYDYRVTGNIDFTEYPLATSAPRPEHPAMALAVVWVAVGSVYILKNRKTKAEP